MVSAAPTAGPERAAPMRVESIQWLRGVAALLVVLVHAIGTALQRAGGTATFVPSIPNLTAFGDSGVDLFFVISGFVMAHSLGRASSARTFLVARWRRIWPLFVLASALFIVLFDAGRMPTLPELLPSVLILPLSETTDYHQPVLTVGWTLGFETMFYLLVALTIARHRGPVTLLVLTLAAGAAGLLIVPPWAPARMLINPITLEFAFGVAVWLIWSYGWGRAVRPALFAAGILLLAAGIAGVLPLFVPAAPQDVVREFHVANRTLVWGFPWALIVLGLLDQAGTNGWVARALATLGDSSYSLYLFHVVVIDALRDYFPVPAASVAWFVAVAVAASVVFGLAVYSRVERPLLRALQPRRAGHLQPAMRAASVAGPPRASRGRATT
jgi:peptidoglycan/LPS O-acetylase OafA/YrhL